jgi:hypothetical protein
VIIWLPLDKLGISPTAQQHEMIGFRTSVPQSPSTRSRSSSTTGAASVINSAALVPRNHGPALRTLDEVREQVSQEIAVHTITKAQVQDGM